MWYSFHKLGLRVSPIVVAVLPCGGAQAADTYVQPRIELRAESSSNLELDAVTNDKSDTYGGVADFAALIGIATPRSETSIRPRIKFQDYADRGNYQNTEAFFDFKTVYQSERSEFALISRYSWQNTTNAEISDAEFDDLDPDDPSVPETSNNQDDETRQRLDFRPTYSYQISERATIGGELGFQGVRYSDAESIDRVEYDYFQGGAFVRWATGPRTDLTIGAYASNYEARQGSDQTDAVGGGVAITQAWSERAASSLEVTFEQNDFSSDEIEGDDRTNNWGASFSTYTTGEVDQWRLTATRTYAPNGRGGKSSFDQFRLQYDRDLSERLHFMAAGRYVKDESIGEVGTMEDRDFSRFEVALTWFMSSRWFVRGAYQYTYLDRESDPETADDNRIMLGVGYQGLGRQSR